MAKRGTSPKQKKEWTEARWHSFIVSILRSGTQRYPPKYETLNEAKTEKKINTKTGRLAQHFMCNACKTDFPAKEVAIDHIVPVVDPETGFKTWDEYVIRMYCSKENFQTLCHDCHKIKTQQEKTLRKK